MNEYRVTRKFRYPPGTPGHKDLSAREGYYIDADNEFDAAKKMAADFPNEQFDVQLWKSPSPSGA